MVTDLIARDEQSQIKREECRSLVGRVAVRDELAELVKPQTFMNLSGEAVKCLLKKEGRSVEKLLVISDDLALPFGKVRIRPKGSHGGHNGLRSIIDCLGTSDFARLRIGILPGHPLSNTKDFVLQNFAKSESAELEDVLRICANAVRTVITDGVERAMAEFNGELKTEN
jgi:Peptidyl-tRNA hydrolase